VKKLGLTQKQKDALKKLAQKPPRMGVKPTKVIRDKTKYTRKNKHRMKP